MKLINKDAVLAEIARQKAQWRICKSSEAKYRREMLDDISSFIDTLEVKEVDLVQELDTWRHNHFHGRRDKDASGEYLERSSQLDIAKYFFELGMSVNNKAQKGE